MRQLAILILFGIFLSSLAPVQPAYAEDRIHVAAEKKPQTLFDWLFGPAEEKPKPTRKATAPIAPRAPVKPIIEKSPTATRVAIFGDSLAIDLANAFDRLYADDSELAIVGKGVGSSGLVRNDFYDWPATVAEAIASNSFDLAVINLGINDRQAMLVDGTSEKPLTDQWKAAYLGRATALTQQLRAAGKPVIWIGLPPMQAPTFSAAMVQIASLQRQAAFAAGAEYVDIFERFADDAGEYAANGPDLNGHTTQMRKTDGIHFSAAGADKLAFYVNQSLKLFYNGGGLSVAIADPLEGTDAQTMQRPPFQGLGQLRLLEVAGAVQTIGQDKSRADQMISARGASAPGIDLDLLVTAPAGRADAFGVGLKPEDEAPAATGPAR